MQWWKQVCKVQPGDCSLVFTSHGFDLMQKNLLGTLAAGGRLQALKLRDHPRADTRNWHERTFTPGHRWSVEWVDIANVEAFTQNIVMGANIQFNNIEIGNSHYTELDDQTG